ncbi:hypothetical protein HY417_03495 [Candidatus Kaiserbacteria bacterium]|nr:hypothetical protein [Candidatus Kaiserbacteria bacterium]
MAKKITFKEIGEMLQHVAKHMLTKEDGEKFLTKEDGEKFATKEQIIALHTQVNSIETQVRQIKRDKLEARVVELEEKIR